MKIIFICGSLEPGKDGVGDYTRRLSVALLEQGVSVGMLAYNDKYILDKIDTFQLIETHKIPCLRLSSKMKSGQRAQVAKKWIAMHKPEWLSLQFVPYAFHNKGFPFRLGSQLKDMAGHIRWHVMIHELWIGMSYQSLFKDKCIGQLQKKIIKKLLTQLAPKAIHTQTELYKYQLQQLGFSASILPLFSNIPLVKTQASSDSNLIKLELPKKYFVIFGSIHKNAPIEEFVKELREYDINRTFSLVALGRNGGELNYWISIFEEHGFDVKQFGEQSIEIISHVLSDATFGLATTPYDLVEKSGSVAAMREHNLPVICFSKPWKSTDFERQNKVKGVIEYKLGNLKSCLEEDIRMNEVRASVATFANLFLDTLKV